MNPFFAIYMIQRAGEAQQALREIEKNQRKQIESQEKQKREQKLLEDKEAREFDEKYDRLVEENRDLTQQLRVEKQISEQAEPEAKEREQAQLLEERRRDQSREQRIVEERQKKLADWAEREMLLDESRREQSKRRKLEERAVPRTNTENTFRTTVIWRPTEWTQQEVDRISNALSCVVLTSSLMPHYIIIAGHHGYVWRKAINRALGGSAYVDIEEHEGTNRVPFPIDKLLELSVTHPELCQ